MPNRSVRLPDRETVTPDTPLHLGTAMRQAIHNWIREDVPLAGKMNLMPKHVDALVERLLRATDPEADRG